MYNKKMKRLLIIEILLCLFIINCNTDQTSDEIKYSDVIGMYNADFVSRYEIASIELKRDSTYIHTYIDQDGDIYSDTGKWIFHNPTSQKYYAHVPSFVRPFPLKENCYCNDSSAIFDFTSYEDFFRFHKYGDKIYLRFCYDPQQFYIKQDTI